MARDAGANRARARRNMQRIRAERRSLGLCPRCGDAPAKPRKTCRGCRMARAVKTGSGSV